MPDVIGQRYVLLETDVRSGGLSTVRKAVDTRDGSSVAVKFVEGPTDELSRRVFDREVKTLRALSHDNIVRYRDAGIDDSGTYYVVLDWVDRNLSDVLAVGPWDSWDKLYEEVARPLLAGLAYAHLKQIEHRDIKPQNVLMTTSGVPLIADFGIAKIRGDELPTEATVAGFRSGPYAPPEFESPIPYVRDVYSIGVLLLQCLTDQKIRDFPEVQAALDSVNVHPDVRRLLEACVHVDPLERPRNASELVTDLAKLARERASRNPAVRNTIWLRLTNAAISQLVGSPDQRAQGVAQAVADLSGEVFATFRFDHESGQHATDAIFLTGNEWRYTLKSDEDGSGCVVTAATKPTFESLESLRRRSLSLPPVFSWTYQEPANRDAAKRGLATLIGALEEHADRQQGAEDPQVSEGSDELFDLWLRILEAREDLARGKLDPLPYKAWNAVGRQTTFTLETPTELDLIGTEWRVHDLQAERKFGWGEVVDQDGETITLLGDRLSEIPTRAMLCPHIGPSEASLARQRDAVVSVRSGAAVRPSFRDCLLNPGSNSQG